MVSFVFQSYRVFCIDVPTIRILIFVDRHTLSLGAFHSDRYYYLPSESLLNSV